jgi:hypothetical protein
VPYNTKKIDNFILECIRYLRFWGGGGDSDSCNLQQTGSISRPRSAVDVRLEDWNCSGSKGQYRYGCQAVLYLYQCLT